MEPLAEFRLGKYVVSTDKSRLDVSVIHDFLVNDSYWANTRTLSEVQKTIQCSICFGVYDGGRQIGFARVLTDHVVVAYLFDVFIVADYRGRGLGKWLVGCVLSHPDLLGVYKWCLGTADAHGLYARYGFTTLSRPENAMERVCYEPIDLNLPGRPERGRR
jgi:GNAT superfamily N-acetyltransferase